MHLFRWREIAPKTNARYFDAQAAADDPAPGKQALWRLTTVKKSGVGALALDLLQLVQGLTGSRTCCSP